MKIIQFNAENIKRLVAVEIRPEGNLVEITGKNGQGKTSILDAIWWALSNNKNVQANPVRDGAEKGFVRLDLGDYVVTKTFKRKADGDVTISLTVENQDGAKYGSPQELLNGFLGDLTFDPLAFARMKAKDQVTALRALVPGYDFDAADKASKKDFDDRTDVNRTIRDLGVRIADIHVADDTPEEPVSIDELMTGLQKAMDNNTAVDGAAAKRTRIEDRIGELEKSISSKRQTIKDIEVQIVAAEQAIEELRDEADGIFEGREKIDIEPLRLKITQAEEINRRVDRRKRRDEMQKELDQAEAKSKALTKAIDDRKEAAAKAVREAKLPVEGLELTEDAVLLNGQPFEQASDAEQLRVSIAVAGAMNPKLRVIRVRDGSLLDDESMAAVSRYAEQHDLQIWLESVQSGRDTAVVIENGMIASHLEAAE